MRVDTGGLRVVAAEPIESAELGREAGRDVPGLEPDDPSTPGAYIRVHRKRRGVSLDQLAVTTKIPRRQLELLEDDRLEELPGMVFTKGFLRCCARALELDPDVVLGLLYEREREHLRARRREGIPAGSSSAVMSRPSRAPQRKKAAPVGLQDQILAWARRQLERLPSARILMWLVVVLLVALIVLIAFTLASGQVNQVGSGGL
ncbi:MAG: helix-turn-helix domain-containing protein [Myxococcales bacterium]|nr:helix-turn-helix domain-containing protein [Myxococcales bacterium]